MPAPSDDARERATLGRPGQYKATHDREVEAARLREALSSQQSDSRAARLADVRRIAMQALLGSDNQNDVEEEVEVDDDEDDAGDDMDVGDVETDAKKGNGRRMQRLRRLHRTLFFARQLQVPDMMVVPPQDLASSWMVMVRPEGDRYLLLSDGGRVEVRRKNGYVLERYTDSRFPRGLTILDVVGIEGPAQESSPAVASSMADVEPTPDGDDDDDTVETEDMGQQDMDLADADMGAGGGYNSGKGRGRASKGKGKGKGKNGRSRPQGNKTYAICDVLVWGDAEMACAEAECRLFFLQSRIEEMRDTCPRRARPLQMLQSYPATQESLAELYRADLGYPKDSLLFLHREGHYQVSQPITPLVLMWRDKHLSRFVVDTPDEKGEALPQKQAVVLEVRGGGHLRTADRAVVAQCNVEELKAVQLQAVGGKAGAKSGGKGAKAGALLRCEVESLDVANRRLLGVTPVAHVPSRSRVWPDSWGRIVFQHLHRDGKASLLSFDVLMQAASGA